MQVLLTTLVVKLAVMAALATMLVRYRRFRHILIFERRAWPDRLTFALSLGIPLASGVVSRLLLKYNAADLTLEGSFLAGLIAGPYAGALVGVMVGVPPIFAGEWIALPFAVGCGFAGGGLREVCPKESIWHFSPFVFTTIHRRIWQMLRSLQIDWQVVLLLAPIALELLRQFLAWRWSEHHRLFYIAPGSVGMRRSDPLWVRPQPSPGYEKRFFGSNVARSYTNAMRDCHVNSMSSFFQTVMPSPKCSAGRSRF